MAYLIQSVFNGIKDIVYPNNCIICNKFVEDGQNCGASKVTGVPVVLPNLDIKKENLYC
jgi:hypothetical protein